MGMFAIVGGVLIVIMILVAFGDLSRLISAIGLVFLKAFESYFKLYKKGWLGLASGILIPILLLGLLFVLGWLNFQDRESLLSIGAIMMFVIGFSGWAWSDRREFYRKSMAESEGGENYDKAVLHKTGEALVTMISVSLVALGIISLVLVSIN